MKRVIGLDFGRVRIGVARSDLMQLIAQPFPCLINDASFLSHLAPFFSPSDAAEKIVLGFPLQMNGQEGQMAQEVRLFASKLETHFSVPVILWDERLTTAQVEKALMEGGMSRKKRSGKVDSLAATLILQTYLDFKGNR